MHLLLLSLPVRLTTPQAVTADLQLVTSLHVRVLVVFLGGASLWDHITGFTCAGSAPLLQEVYNREEEHCANRPKTSVTERISLPPLACVKTCHAHVNITRMPFMDVLFERRPVRVVSGQVLGSFLSCCCFFIYKAHVTHLETILNENFRTENTTDHSRLELLRLVFLRKVSILVPPP